LFKGEFTKHIKEQYKIYHRDDNENVEEGVIIYQAFRVRKL